MWGPRDEPPPVERVRKAQWTVENTRKTQEVVDRLLKAKTALIVVLGKNSLAVHAMTEAVERFRVLDPNVKVE